MLNVKEKGFITNKHGITLIALVITIIILLILAGVSISLTIGQNGILSRAQDAVGKTEKAQAKEELEMKISEIETNKILEGKAITKNDLQQLEEIGAVIILDETPIQGEYKNYNFTIDDNYKVTMFKGGKAKVELSLDSEEILETVIIKVNVSMDDGTIEYIQKPDGTRTTETSFEYAVTSNDDYTFIVKGSNGLVKTETIPVENVKEVVAKPIIKSFYGCPTLTTEGVLGDGKTTIIFDDTKNGLENSYSLDNGATWTVYEGPFYINKECTIKAKSVKKGVILAENSKTITTQSGMLGANAYDNNETSGESFVSAKLMVDESMRGKKFVVNAQDSYPGYGCNIKEYLTDGTSKNLASSEKFITDVAYTLDENAEYLMFTCSSGYRMVVYDIYVELVTRPVVSSTLGIPTLTSSGVINDGKTTITYSNESGLENFYSLDDGATWLPYTGPFYLTQNTTVRAKSVKDGIIVAKLKQSITAPGGMLGANAYDTGDNSDTTYEDIQTAKLMVDASMRGKTIRVKAQDTYPGYGCNIKQVLLDKTEKSLVSSTKFIENVEYTLDENIDYLEFRCSSGYRMRIFYIKPVVN